MVARWSFVLSAFDPASVARPSAQSTHVFSVQCFLFLGVSLRVRGGSFIAEAPPIAPLCHFCLGTQHTAVFLFTAPPRLPCVSVCAKDELAHDGDDPANDRARIGSDCLLLHGVGDLAPARVWGVLQEDAGTGECSAVHGCLSWVCNCQSLRL